MNRFVLFQLLDQYGNVWSGGMSSSYGYDTNHNNLSSLSSLHPSGQSRMKSNNM